MLLRARAPALVAACAAASTRCDGHDAARRWERAHPLLAECWIGAPVRQAVADAEDDAASDPRKRWPVDSMSGRDCLHRFVYEGAWSSLSKRCGQDLVRSSLTLRELGRVGARDQVGEETHYKDTGWRVALRGFGDGRERELTGAALVAAARALKRSGAARDDEAEAEAALFTMFELVALVALAGELRGSLVDARATNARATRERFLRLCHALVDRGGEGGGDVDAAELGAVLALWRHLGVLDAGPPARAAAEAAKAPLGFDAFRAWVEGLEARGLARFGAAWRALPDAPPRRRGAWGFGPRAGA